MPFSSYPALLYWPSLLDRDRLLTWELGAKAISGGKALSQIAPAARVDGGGLWMATLTDVQASTADQVRAWLALAARLDGGATPVVLTKRDVRLAPWPTVGGVAVTSNETTHDDDSLFSDDSGYAGGVISASLVNAASLRATTLTVSLAVGSALRGGEHFSIEHETFSHRIYRVAAVTVNGSGQSVLTIRPPLREDVTAGTRLEFDNPKCVMQLANPDEMDLALDMRFQGKASPRFIESFPPFS